MILQKDHESLIKYKEQGTDFDLSIPTPEHYIPLLYTLALESENENESIFNNTITGGSMGMMSMLIH